MLLADMYSSVVVVAGFETNNVQSELFVSRMVSKQPAEVVLCTANRSRLLSTSIHTCRPFLLEIQVKQVPLDRLMVETDAPYLGFTGCRKGHTKPKKQV